MPTTVTWRIDHTKILTRGELAAVLAILGRKAQRSQSTRMNLIIVRLACCCGLRVSEIAQLRLGNLRLDCAKPYVEIPSHVAKGGRARRVPLWWDGGTLADLAAWNATRREQGAQDADLVVCCRSARKRGSRLSRQTLRRRFLTACKCLGTERVSDLTIHHGRHTFISHALAGGRTLAEVRDAVGHSNVSITSCYLHIAVDDDGIPGNLFDFDARG